MKIAEALHVFVSMKAGVFLGAVIAAAASIITIVDPMGQLFQSNVFRALLAVFFVQLSFCTLRQIIEFKRTYKEPVFLKTFGGISEKTEVKPDDIGCAAVKLLSEKGYRCLRRQSGNRILIRGEKGLAGKIGGITLHLAILIILAAGYYGSCFGFETTVEVPIGGNEPVKTGDIDLGQIYLNGFRIEHYSDGGVSEFVSDIRYVFEDHAVEGKVTVNHPFSVMGMSVYQVGHGYQVSVKSLTGTAYGWFSEYGVIPPTQNSTELLQIIGYDPNLKTVAYAAYDTKGLLFRERKPLNQSFAIKKDGERFLFNGVREYSRLLVKKDPGIPFLFGGFLLLVVAFFAAIFIRHRIIFVSIFPEESGSLSMVQVMECGNEHSEGISQELIGKLKEGQESCCG